MNKIDMNSALKAGAIAAGVAVVLNLLSFIPFVGGLFAVLSVCGAVLIPIGGGMAYGYLAEGKEDTQTAAIGGAIAGGIGGVIMAIMGAIISSIIGVGGGIGGGIVGSICSGIFGFALGALGGVIWPMIQDKVSGAK
ncbi:MAG: hypothetical protein ACI9EW_001517 [Cellvibrionaceae bacterium]|jgi:hypothetical protein